MRSGAMIMKNVGIKKCTLNEVMQHIGTTEFDYMSESEKHLEAVIASYFKCSECGLYVHHSNYSSVDGDVCDECNEN